MFINVNHLAAVEFDRDFPKEFNIAQVFNDADNPIYI
jgi:hypothetical protein